MLGGRRPPFRREIRKDEGDAAFAERLDDVLKAGSRVKDAIRHFECLAGKFPRRVVIGYAELSSGKCVVTSRNIKYRNRLPIMRFAKHGNLDGKLGERCARRRCQEKAGKGGPRSDVRFPSYAS